MTETRKKIIELIEPYMNKELSEGCLLDFQDWHNICKISNLNLEENRFTDTQFWEVYNILDEYDICLYKILWHYDISAIDKYILDMQSDAYINKTIRRNRIEYHELLCWEFEIPNKPLQLYTEQEEKYLLSKLLELWNK